MMNLPTSREIENLLTEAEMHLRRLSVKRLQVANDFLAYLSERENNEATEELLSIPGFEEAMNEAVEQAETGDLISFSAIRRDV